MRTVVHARELHAVAITHAHTPSGQRTFLKSRKRYCCQLPCEFAARAALLQPCASLQHKSYVSAWVRYST